MIWKHAAHYPKQILFALWRCWLRPRATLAIPMRGFKVIIDKAFGPSQWPTFATIVPGLLMIVVVLGLARRCGSTSSVVAGRTGRRRHPRLAVQDNLLRLRPRFFEENSPKEISSRMTSDTAVIEQVVGTTVSVALRNLITGGRRHRATCSSWRPN
jgi:ATP-binding cassette subfamily B protein